MSAYTERVAYYLKGLRYLGRSYAATCNECFGCDHSDGEDCDCGCETRFSGTPCEVCDGAGASQGHLGGDRHVVHAVDKKTDELVHLVICPDCLVYLENGDEPEGED